MRLLQRCERFHAIWHHVARKTQQRQLMADQFLIHWVIFCDKHKNMASKVKVVDELWDDNFGVTNRYEMPLKSSTGG